MALKLYSIIFFFIVISELCGVVTGLEQTGLVIAGMALLSDIKRMIVETWFRN